MPRTTRGCRSRGGRVGADPRRRGTPRSRRARSRFGGGHRRRGQPGDQRLDIASAPTGRSTGCRSSGESGCRDRPRFPPATLPPPSRSRAVSRRAALGGCGAARARDRSRLLARPHRGSLPERRDVRRADRHCDQPDRRQPAHSPGANAIRISAPGICQLRSGIQRRRRHPRMWPRSNPNA